MSIFQIGTIKLDQVQREKVEAVLTALEDFLMSPNETATEKNNILQKAAGLARKSIVGETPKKVKSGGR